MKTLLFILALILLVAFAQGCAVESKPIPYGAANCAHCNMTVTDNRYGAELVNDKGKAYFFDSAECLLAYLNEQPEQGQKASFILVSDYTKPSELIDARNATFLQSPALPSPMGMNLSAIGDKAKATQIQEEIGGRLLSWNQAAQAVKNNERPQ